VSRVSHIWAGHSRVAQLVEQTAVNRRVGGSSPSSGAFSADVFAGVQSPQPRTRLIRAHHRTTTSGIVTDKTIPDPKRAVAQVFENKKVLIVDDEPDVRDLVAMMLRVRGVNAIIADECDGALTTLNEDSDIGAVVIDLNLPSQDDQAAYVHVNLAFPSLPIVVMSGYPEPHGLIGRLGNRLGFLKKPFRPDTLYTTLVASQGTPSKLPSTR
jgi:CheY-like chemotaxis protein